MPRMSIAIMLLNLAPGLTACGVGYHFSGVQAIADPSGVVHVAASVDIETEGGGGPVRVEVASFGPDGVRRSSVGMSRMADRALFVDGTGALHVISKHWPDAPIARRVGNRWTRVSLAPDLSEEARKALPDIEILGVGWTDAAGATRVYLPQAGLGGWIYDLDAGVVTGAARLAATVEGTFRVVPRSADRLGAWLADAGAACQRPCDLACGGEGCAWTCDPAVCLGPVGATGGWTAEGVPVTASTRRDASTGQSFVVLAWPGGKVDVPVDVSTGEALHLRPAPRAGGGLLVAAYARLEPTVALLAFDADFGWKKELFEAAAPDDVLYDFGVAGTREGDADLGHLVFATSFRVKHWTIDLGAGTRTLQELAL